VRPGLIVVLSPRMVYSLLEWPRLQREAFGLGFWTLVWQDPQVPDSEWAAAMASGPMVDWPLPKPVRPPQNCLADWLPFDHVPYVRVVLGQWLHTWPIWGVMPGQHWQAVLLNRRGALVMESEVSP
jgi:hypothetical protein